MAKRRFVMWRTILIIAIIAHGLAHLSGFVAAWSTADVGFSARWMFLSSELSLHSSAGKLFGLLWLAAAGTLVAAGAGLFWQRAWAVPLALTGAVLSLAVILPWWNTVPPGAKLGALFDLLVLALLFSPLKAGMAAVR
jgi:hypothetical protein